MKTLFDKTQFFDSTKIEVKKEKMDAFHVDLDEYKQMYEDMMTGRIKKTSHAKDIFETDNDIYERFGINNFRVGFNAARKKINRPEKTKTSSK